jgi:hypothetical protein
MNYGRLNIIVGGTVLFLGAAGGFLLGFTMDPYFEKGFYAIPLTRVLIKAGHTHGMPFALYNIIIGSLIDRLALDDAWKKRCSLAAVFAFLMPIGLILRGVDNGAIRFAAVVFIGAVLFLTSAGIMIKGAVSSTAPDKP